MIPSPLNQGKLEQPIGTVQERLCITIMIFSWIREYSSCSVQSRVRQFRLHFFLLGTKRNAKRSHFPPSRTKTNTKYCLQLTNNVTRSCTWTCVRRVRQGCLVENLWRSCTSTKLSFPKQNYNVLSSSSYTHISVRDLYISRIGLPILLQENTRTKGHAILRKGIHKWDFCCSV